MKVTCGHCGKVYHIPDDRLPGREAISFPCPACKGIIELTIRANRAAPSQGEQPGGESLKRRILKTVQDLPPMPQTVIKAQTIIRDPHSNFKELAATLETDQALAAKVLRMANSPFYALAGKVSSLQHASVVLGQKALEELIALAGTRSFLGGRLEGYGLESGDLWLHSIAVALGSKFIAAEKAPQLVPDAFSAGLIHDAGKLALDPYVRERKTQFDAFLEKGGESFTSAEKNILGFTHAEIAAELCGIWRIPKPLIRAIACHHEPSSGGDVLCDIVHTADALAMMSGIGVGIDGMQYPLDPRALEVLGLEEERVNEIMVKTAQAVYTLAEEMGTN